MGHPGGKLFLPLAGKILLVYPVNLLLQHFPGSIVVVLPSEDRDTLCQNLSEGVDRILFADPGETRNGSVCNAMELADQMQLSGDHVLIHDAARPLIVPDVLQRLQTAMRDGFDGAIPVLPVADTLLMVDETGHPTGYPDRSVLRRVQTPQIFRRDHLRDLLLHTGSREATDESSLVFRHGGRLACIEGDPRMLKVTIPEDLALIESLLHNEVNSCHA